MASGNYRDFVVKANWHALDAAQQAVRRGEPPEMGWRLPSQSSRWPALRIRNWVAILQFAGPIREIENAQPAVQE